MTYSPADVIRYALVEHSVGSLPTANTAWPICIAEEPSTPDNVITIYDTTPVLEGRDHISGETQQHDAIQIRIRSTTYPIGWAKASDIIRVIDQDILREVITISAEQYLLHNITRSGGILSVGIEPNSKRHIFTINALASIVSL